MILLFPEQPLHLPQPQYHSLLLPFVHLRILVLEQDHLADHLRERHQRQLVHPMLPPQVQQPALRLHQQQHRSPRQHHMQTIMQWVKLSRLVLFFNEE